MIKKIVKCVAFAAITLLVLNFIYGFLVIKDTNGGTDELLFSSVRQLENTPRNTVDVMFLGSSHCYNSIYPAVMWDEYGISAFDLAVTCQFKSVTYEMLKKSLRRQSPKVVCVEVFELDSGGPDEEEVGALYRNFLSVKSTLGLYNVLKEEDQENKSDFISRWPIVHTRYREFKQNDFVTSSWDKYGRGGEFRDGQTGGYFSGDSSCDDVVEISEENREWVDKMVALSKKEKFELVLFLSPYAVFSEEERAVYNGIQEYANSIGVPFINFIDEAAAMGYDPAYDMMNDFHHCNLSGAAKVSGYMGSFLNENYDLASHKGDKKYEAWEMDLKMYNQVRVTKALFASKNQEEYFGLLSKMNNVEVILSTEGEEFGRLVPYLEFFGISQEEALKGGKWLYKNKQATRIEPDKNKDYAIVDLDRFVSVKVSENDPLTNLIYNQWPICFTENGLNIIVYDTLFNKSIDVRGF